MKSFIIIVALIVVLPLIVLGIIGSQPAADPLKSKAEHFGHAIAVYVENGNSLSDLWTLCAVEAEKEGFNGYDQMERFANIARRQAEKELYKKFTR